MHGKLRRWVFSRNFQNLPELFLLVELGCGLCVGAGGGVYGLVSWAQNRNTLNFGYPAGGKKYHQGGYVSFFCYDRFDRMRVAEEEERDKVIMFS
jgi:hypothetical protein